MVQSIDIIVITRHRSVLLERAIRSVLGIPGVSVIVLINGSDARSSELCAELVREHRGLRVIELAERLKPGQARNVALRSASAEWIFFLDDDAYVGSDYFSLFHGIQEKYPQAAVIGGPNLTPPSSTPFQVATGKVLASPFATYLSRARYRAAGGERPAGEESLILCNLWIRATELRKLGTEPFSPHLDCNEENYLLQQLSARSEYRSGHAQIIYSPELYVWHERRDTWSGLLAQVFKYGKGRAQNFWLQPSSLHWAHVVPAFCILSAPVLAVLGMCQQLWALGPFLVYAVTVLVFSVRVGVLGPPLFVSIHVSYGLGFLFGLCHVTRLQRDGVFGSRGIS